MKEGKEIRIGAIYPFTGSQSAVGKDIRQAIDLAVEIVNNRYDLDLPLARTIGLPILENRKFKVIYGDSEGIPEIGREEAKRLIVKEKVAALIGSYQSSVTLQASAIAEARKVPFLTPDASAPSLTERDFQFFFRTAPNDHLYTNLFFELFHFLRSRGREINNFAILTEDSIFGLEAAVIEKSLIRKFSGELAAFEIYTPPVTSLVNELTRIRKSKAQAVFGHQFLSDAINVVQGLKRLNWFPEGLVVQNAGYTIPEFLETVGKDGNYIISRVAWALGLGRVKPIVTEVNELYRSKYKEDMNETNARSFTGLLVLADAINRAGSINKDKIVQSLRQTNMPGKNLIMPWRGVRFDSNGQNILADALLAQIINQEYKIIWPLSVAETPVVWPAPPWNQR
ncbi:ABC transporter substrate-binding protein [Mesobacillus sp. AQ2]|uniref:ABC transporter substrate-binding protein n=1 Tax=Mesobacillus sp. AQ2 TaxID=3043332 RepID=UPI0024C1E8B7|nr:ABC transporter substrate-binding protein [Mesobacillus sp. AQ2]WHX40972.1 ABC transporter substrate-binding protein [Mesobacillus sp. AQ2]